MADPSTPLRLNGVFKGGGAKGLVYAGALRAVYERGLRFQSVAGSSAGAITATLVALQLPIDDLEQAATEAMGYVKRRFGAGFLPFAGRTLFAVRPLGEWLDGLLRERVEAAGVPLGAGTVTFELLFEVTEIELNVVAMDLHRRQPVVFNRITTPDVQVSEAVLASCAIPLAMSPGRARVQGATPTRTEVRRLVDGGAWANFPLFVYTDRSFRAYHGLPPLSEDERNLGFVIDPPPTTDVRAGRVAWMETQRRSRYDLGSAGRLGGKLGNIGALFTWPFMQALGAVFFPLLLAGIILSWLRSEANGFFPVLDLFPNWLQPVALAVITGAVVVFLALTVAAAVFVYRFAAEALDVGLPTLLASLSVGPRVPDWVGATPGDDVVRLSVPYGISTLSVRGVSKETRDAAIARAYLEARRTLELMFPNHPAPDPYYPVPVDPPTPSPRQLREWAARFGYAVLLYVGLVVTALLVPFVFQELAVGDPLNLVFGGAAMLVLMGVILVIIYFGGALRARRLASGRAATPRTGFALLVVAAALLVLTLHFGTLHGPAGGPLSRFANTEQIPARVTAKKRDGILDWYYKVVLSRPVRGVGRGTLERFCDDSTSDGHRCLVFYTSLGGLLGLSIPHPADVLVVKTTREVFLGAGDIWASSDLVSDGMELALIVLLAVLVVWGLFDLTVWVRERRT